MVSWTPRLYAGALNLSASFPFRPSPLPHDHPKRDGNKHRIILVHEVGAVHRKVHGKIRAKKDEKTSRDSLERVACSGLDEIYGVNSFPRSKISRINRGRSLFYWKRAMNR